MTSLFSRLQKLNKEATPGPWESCASGYDPEGFSIEPDVGVAGQNDAALIVECRNSLPAVLNLIEAVVSKCVFCSKGQPRVSMGRNGAFHQVKVAGDEEWSQLSCPLTDVEAEAVAVFVSGQEEPS